MSEAGKRILKGLHEAVEWQKGETKLKVHLPDGTTKYMTFKEYRQYAKQLRAQEN